MSVMLFKLRGVEEDEADEIRALLDTQGFDYYETSNGRWGLGFAAIWLHDESQLEHGKRLIQTYQAQRCEQARKDYAELCEQGLQPTTWSMIRANPLQVVITLAAVLMIIALVLSPFVGL